MLERQAWTVTICTSRKKGTKNSTLCSSIASDSITFPNFPNYGQINSIPTGTYCWYYTHFLSV